MAYKATKNSYYVPYEAIAIHDLDDRHHILECGNDKLVGACMVRCCGRPFQDDDWIGLHRTVR